jgi:fatty-acyl-CoA synthase
MSCIQSRGNNDYRQSQLASPDKTKSLSGFVVDERFETSHASMLHLLAERGDDNKPRLFIYNAGQCVARLSYRDIYHGAVKRAHRISGLVGHTNQFILLEGANDANAVINFFAIQLAGHIPVPVATSLWVTDTRYREVISSIYAATAARFLIASSNAQRTLAGVDLAILDADQLAAEAAPVNVDVNAVVLPRAGDVAYLQFSSGSTGTPKGVVISHYNMMSNITQLHEHLQVDPINDVTVCWLPIHHDMGLLAGFLIPLYNGLDCHMMNPYDFAVNPNRWLKLVSQVRATIITGPNSAFHMAVKKVKPANVKQLDLSAVRIAMCAAEPINSKTLGDFHATFKAAGFKASAFLPAYGLAENTLGVSLYSLDAPIHIDRIEKDAYLNERKAVPSRSGGGVEFVACGKPLRGITVKIVDDNDNELADRCIGNILVGGPSTSCGYYGRDDLNGALFCGSLLRTGDLGYFADGEIYITGRKKDIIIINGQNINAEEIENHAIRMSEIRAGRLAAFAASSDQTESEQVHLVIETQVNAKYLLERNRQQLRRQIADHVSKFIAVKPEQITLLPPGALLKTTSGKVRRAEMKSLFEQHRLPDTALGFSYQFIRYKIATLQLAAKVLLLRLLPAIPR